MKTDTLLLLAGGAALIYFLFKTGVITGATQAAPLSVYPSLAFTQITSMAKTPAQKASTAVPVAPISAYEAAQAQEQQALLAQCAGSYPGCSVLMGDTQLL